jgi:phenol hydroxylase P4 protein
MPVSAIRKDYYTQPPRDAVENFHGNLVVYTSWDGHLLYAFPAAFPLPPQMPFRKLLEDVLPPVYSLHPDFAKINWDEVQWLLDRQPFTPKLDASLAENGVGHKSVIRFITPGLNGMATGF